MIQLPPVWTLLTVSLWAAASSELLRTEPVTILYPNLKSSESMDCPCGDYCDSAYWFHSVPSEGKVKFLGRCNKADRVNFGVGYSERRFKLSKKGSTSFQLRIINVTEKDTGIYSCVLKDKSNDEMWRPGTLLLPGVTPPTLPPKTKPKPPVKPICTCKKNPSKVGCGALVLWPLVGLISGLTLAVLCTLNYFSRLPKKCRHHFVKRGK